MRILITGMNGTVAPALARAFEAGGHVVTGWNRDVVPVDDESSVRRFIDEVRPDWFCHVAMGSPDWTELVAAVCAESGIEFLFTSSVSVYAASQTGPFSVGDVPVPDDDYGRYKLECEARVRRTHPRAWIARLGWQIGEAPGSNNMVDYLHSRASEDGRVTASRNWLVSCAMLEDTAEALVRIVGELPAGLYHLEGNPGLSFFEVARGLNRLHGLPWTIVPSDEPERNNLMFDDRVILRSLSSRLEGEGHDSVGPGR